MPLTFLNAIELCAVENGNELFPGSQTFKNAAYTLYHIFFLYQFKYGADVGSLLFISRDIVSKIIVVINITDDHSNSCEANEHKNT